jgi:O-methyltransferase
MPDISSRTKTFSESIIRRMTRVANDVGAINLSHNLQGSGKGGHAHRTFSDLTIMAQNTYFSSLNTKTRKLQLFKKLLKKGILLIDTLLLRVSPLFLKTGFFLQGQMDIHPRSYWHTASLCSTTGGFFPKESSVERTLVDVEPWDQVRRDMIVLLLRSILERRIEGDLAELGVWKGYTAKLIHHYIPERSLHLFDTFAGFDKRDLSAEMNHTGHHIGNRDFSDTSVDVVLKYIQPVRDTVICHPGFFPESISAADGEKKYAFVHLDADLYEPIMAGLRFFYERMMSGGFILLHDYNAWPGVRKAADEFCSEARQIIIPFPDKSGSALIVKS